MKVFVAIFKEALPRRRFLITFASVFVSNVMSMLLIVVRRICLWIGNKGQFRKKLFVVSTSTYFYRSSHWQMLFKIVFLKNFTNFVKKQLCWSLSLFSKVTGMFDTVEVELWVKKVFCWSDFQTAIWWTCQIEKK